MPPFDIFRKEVKLELTKSAERTLESYYNACQYYSKNYHFRSLLQTLDVKDKIFHIKRSLSTINRENRLLVEKGLIVKWKRTTTWEGLGRRFTSSITHLNWSGVMYLVRHKIMPRSIIKIWKRIAKHAKRFDSEVRSLRQVEPISDQEKDERSKIYRMNKEKAKI